MGPFKGSLGATGDQDTHTHTHTHTHTNTHTHTHTHRCMWMWMALERFWTRCEGLACPRQRTRCSAMPPSGCLTTNFLTVRVRVCACMMPCTSGACVSMWVSLRVMRRREGQRRRKRTRSNRIVASVVRGVRSRRQARLLRQDPRDVGMHASAA